MERKGKTFIDVRLAEDWKDPERVVRVRLPDVVKFYHKYHNDFMSTIRELGPILGDHRPVGYIARDCLEYFKQVNRKGLAREARKYGMELRG